MFTALLSFLMQCISFGLIYIIIASIFNILNNFQLQPHTKVMADLIEAEVTKDNEMSDTLQTDNVENVTQEGDLASICVDQSLLVDTNISKLSNDTAKTAYRIDDTVFFDDAEERVDDSSLPFELYAKRIVDKIVTKMENDMDMYCSTPTETDSETEEEDLDTPLQATIHPVPHGMIINNIVYLTEHQWHTLLFADVKMCLCAVCNMFCELDSCPGHISDEIHKRNLDMYKPLNKYDMSITRKIRQKLHCGVCNELFDLKDETNHFGCKMHEGNLLFAINKASDIIYDVDLYASSKNDCIHFNDNQIIDRPPHFSDTISNCSNDTNYNYINFQNNEDFEDFEYEPLNIGTSYATMAKKPKVITPNFIEIDLGNNMVRVRFDSWHMVIINRQTNRIWCMACKKFYHLRLKTEHCASIDHLKKLDLCKVVAAYEEYFIRQVDDKLYHCGNCNHLQLIHEMERHIETKHPRKNKICDNKIAKPIPATSPNNDGRNKNNDGRNTNNDGRNTNNDGRNNNNDSPTPVKTNPMTKPLSCVTPIKFNDNAQNVIKNTRNGVKIDNDNNRNKNNIVLAGVFDDIAIYPFGFKLTIPILYFNVVCKRVGDYYCGLCDIICAQDMIAGHIYGIGHIELLQRTPFILPFSSNLIRAIREALHCAICNIPVSADMIYNHIRDTSHINLLTKALGVIPKEAMNNALTDATTIPPPPIIPINIENSVVKAPIDDKDTIVDDSITFNEEDVVSDDNEFNDESDDEIMNETFDSANDEVTFDMEEYVYLKLRNSYIKIANSSYNTLVHVGDGTRYCFVCALQVDYGDLQKHVDSRAHLENIELYRFLDKYEDHLLRQIYLMYHCSICNVLITRKDLKTHLEWPTHALQNDNTVKNIKKTRKNEIKGGVKQIIVSTQKENIYLNEKEPKMKILIDVDVVERVQEKPKVESVQNPDLNPSLVPTTKKNKIIIFNDNVLKITWESWHGIARIKNGYKCNLCQRDLKTNEIDIHCNSEWHKYALDKPFEKQYPPALIRKINESTLNCLICNTEVSNKEHLVLEHINGKKHAKNYEAILKDSSMANTYTDCNDDVLML